MAPGRVQAIDSKGCSKILVGFSTSFNYLNSPRPSDLMSQASQISIVSGVSSAIDGPFKGLVICVTGLSKEARRQVMSVTQRLGGQYSAGLHSQCTHLVVQSFSGRKFEHAMKHGLKNGLHVVTLGWFMDSVRRNVKMNESLYSVRSAKENSLPVGISNQHTGHMVNEQSCLPSGLLEENRPSNLIPQSSSHSSHKDSKMSITGPLASEYFYVDSNISGDLKNKVIEALNTEGAKVLEQWFVGCHANHVVCEAPYIQRYFGHTNNLVTPLWILKTAKEKRLQRLVHLSSDLARNISLVLESAQDIDEKYGRGISSIGCTHQINLQTNEKDNLETREKIADLAKTGVRNRRHLRMQSCQMPLRPITPSSLLDSICWSISEPTSTAGIYTDFAETDDASENHASANPQTERRGSELSFDNLSRPLKEWFTSVHNNQSFHHFDLSPTLPDALFFLHYYSEKVEVIFRGHLLTILFPIDRFGELGPSSRTFFSENGFKCLQVLDLIFNFYQENLSADEVAVAIHTDSRHGDRLRSVYASKDPIDRGFVAMKRVEFLGSRRSFEVLKRVSGENNSNVYELVIRA